MPSPIPGNHQRIARELGFKEIQDVEDRHSVAEAFPPSRGRCGIYLLVFNSGLFYIGQSVDVVQRFGQHRLVHEDIVGLSFQRVARQKLDEVERDLIWKAESRGLPLTNIVHVADVIGETDFDLLMSAEAQQEWIQDPRNHAALELAQERNRIGNQQSLRYEKRFAKFQRHPHAEEVVGILRRYLCNCMPAFRRAEGSFWSLSCLPSTGGKTWGRLAVVNVRSVEVLAMGQSAASEARDFTWGYFNIAESILKEVLGGMRGIRQVFAEPHFTIERNCYPSAGQDLLQIRTYEISFLSEALDIPDVQRAARVMNLRQFRKGACLYSKFHCPQLAELVVSRPER